MGACESCNQKEIEKNQEVLKYDQQYQVEPIKESQFAVEQKNKNDFDEIVKFQTTSEKMFNNTPSKKTITLQDGSTYEGQINSNNLPNGYGTQTWKNGDIFNGYFVSGLKHGIGKFIKKGSYIYHGNFANNKLTGYGQMTFQDGKIYKGNFKDGVFEGEGEIVKANGEKQKGMFRNGEFFGGFQLISKILKN